MLFINRITAAAKRFAIGGNMVITFFFYKSICSEQMLGESAASNSLEQTPFIRLRIVV